MLVEREKGDTHCFMGRRTIWSEGRRWPQHGSCRQRVWRLLVEAGR
jgi:hypothetical protein